MVFSAVAGKEKVFKITIFFIPLYPAAAFRLPVDFPLLLPVLAFISTHFLPTVSLLNILKTLGLAAVKSFNFPPQVGAA